MASFVPANLPAGLVEPGIHTTIKLDGDPGLSAPSNRCLITGYVGTGGTYPLNQPVRALSLDEVNAGARSYSMLAHAFQAAKSQVPIGAEIWLLPLGEPSGGTAQVVSVTFQGEPTLGVLSSATTAAAADTVYVAYRGRGVSVGIKAGDDWATIATNVKAAWDDIDDAPAACTRSTATLSFTARHKGDFDDGAVEIGFASKGASGCAASFGTMTVANAAGGTGTCVIKMGVKSATVAVTNGDAATATGTGIVTKLNSDSYPIRAAQPSSPTGTVTLFYVNGRPIRPLSVSSTETGLSGQTVTDAVGTAGAGNPSLTSALANIAADDAAKFKITSVFWTTVTEWSTLAAQIVAQDAPPYNKGGVAVCTLTGSLAALSTLSLPTSTTPRLDGYDRFPVLWAAAAPNAGWELSARLAAAVAAESYIARNWNGFEFQGSVNAPLVAIHAADRPSADDRNTAISLRHCPLTVNSAGNMAMTWGGVSYKSKGTRDAKRTKLSTRLTLDYFRDDLNSYLSAIYSGKKVKLASAPRTSNAVELSSVEADVYLWTKRLDDVDLFDGAEAARDAIKTAVIVSPGRIDVNIPFKTLADLDIVAPVGIVE